jgi:diguanylate cyclase (GGDEF)-like protein/PAS domain S-box-containing protein
MGSPLTITLPATGLSRSDYRDLMGASPLPLAVIDRSGDIVEANRAFAALLDTTIARLRDQRLPDLTHRDDRPALERALEALVLAGNRSDTVSIRLLAGADEREPGWVPVTAHLSATGADGTTHLLLAAVDLRTPALAPGTLDHAATHDPLTGLLNRAGLMDQLQRLLDEGRQASLALLDLDALGPVDDAYGHAGGDHLLRRVADALADLTRPDGLACRLAGDEFVVIADTDDDQALGRVLTEELARLQVEVAPGVVLASMPSVGTSPVHAGLTPSQVLAHADDQMYAVKQRRQDALSRV